MGTDVQRSIFVLTSLESYVSELVYGAHGYTIASFLYPHEVTLMGIIFLSPLGLCRRRIGLVVHPSLQVKRSCFELGGARLFIIADACVSVDLRARNARPRHTIGYD